MKKGHLCSSLQLCQRVFEQLLWDAGGGHKGAHRVEQPHLRRCLQRHRLVEGKCQSCTASLSLPSVRFAQFDCIAHLHDTEYLDLVRRDCSASTASNIESASARRM